jgi:hypothetical protein
MNPNQSIELVSTESYPAGGGSSAAFAAAQRANTEARQVKFKEQEINITNQFQMLPKITKAA